VRVLVDDRWVDGYLDPTPGPRDYLIAVTHWVTGSAVEGLFFERRARLGLVVDYLREVGVRGTARRIRSRRAERVRNRRYVACGVGRLLTAPADRGGRSAGAKVAFIAPAGPLCADRVAVHESLAQDPPESLREADAGALWHVRHERAASAFDRLAGWSEWSGIDLEPDVVREAHEACAAVLGEAPWDRAARLETSDGGAALPKRERGRADMARRGRPSAVLAGYGNYAKTTILPNVRRLLDVRAVHDIDPLQLGPRAADGEVEWSTGPDPDVGRFDVLLAAGYHHTHAPIAARALAQGKAAVVEKPLATTRAQLETIEDAAGGGGGRMFLCFQRRYTRLNDYAREDLGVGPGQPIDYHCVVFEEPLPARHWYGWPSSGSRLVSNGCHWIDHFLYLNGFAEVQDTRVETPRPDLINATIKLRNGAVFTMVLTDVGSGRVGMREHVELRAGDVTVTIADGHAYVAESSVRRLRRTTVNKLDAYRRMYRTIAERIAAGRPGDDLVHDLLSARLTLDLQDALPPASRAAEAPAPGSVLRSG
jgi:predicted dehydrogenase